MYQQFIKAFHQHQASTGEILIVAVALISLLILILLREKWEKELTKQFLKRRAKHDFSSACLERELLPEEVKLLHLLIEKSRSEYNCNIVLSNLYFDRIVNAVIALVPDKNLPEFNNQIAHLRLKLGFRPPPRGRPLSSTRELPAGQNIYIALSEGQFLEGVTHAVDETMVMVRLLAGTPYRAQLQPGRAVNIYFNRPGDARYSGSAYILHTASNEDGHHAILSHSVDLARDQRRMDFRIEENRMIGLWVSDSILDKAGDPYSMLLDLIPETARLEDLSAGGALVVFRRYVSYGKCIYLNLDPTGELGLPIIKGTVIRVGTRKRLEHWALSVRFEDLRPSDRQKIVGYVFNKERHQIQVA
jgi:c-di-GMP-binding flagellar brake protein YcgR